MPAAFGDLWNELMSVVRPLDSLTAKKYINRAWSDIGQSYEWSWLRALGVFTAPDAITTGTVSISQFSRNLTFNAAATTVLDAIGLDIPLSTRQIKIGSGPPYNIASYTAGGTATLDPLGPSYQETTASGSTFSIVKCYYSPPATDFARFVAARDPISGYTLRFGPKYTQELLDHIDPQRIDGSEPLVIATCYTQLTDAGIAGGGSATGEITAYTPQFEIWPHPQTARGFQLAYRRRTTDFVNDDDTIPSSIDPELLLWRAKYHSYEWCETNKGSQPQLQTTNWVVLMAGAQAQYQDQLRSHIKHDREQFPNRRVFQQLGVGRYDPPWLQSHADPIAEIEAITGTRVL